MQTTKITSYLPEMEIPKFDAKPNSNPDPNFNPNSNPYPNPMPIRFGQMTFRTSELSNAEIASFHLSNAASCKVLPGTAALPRSLFPPPLIYSHHHHLLLNVKHSPMSLPFCAHAPRLSAT